MSLLMAHRDASLRRTDWVAIEGIADMPAASRTSGCDATDPKETCRPYLTYAQLVDRSNTAPAIDGAQRSLPMCFGTGPCRAWTEAITKPRSCNFTDQSLTKALRASTGHSSFDLRKHRGSRRPARSTKTGISWRILLPWDH